MAIHDSQPQTTDLPLLVVQAQQGDNRAFDQIIQRFQDMAFATAYSILGDPGMAQDAAQEAFMDAYHCLGNLREPVAFPAWFRRVIVKHCDRQTRPKRVSVVPLDNAYSARSPMPDPLEAIESLQLQEDVHEAIRLLPQNQRIVTALFYVEGYSQQEIADFLEIPLTAVKKRLVNARKNLKKRMTTMVQATLQATKPSQNQAFQNKVSFFLALRENDLAKIEAMIDATPELLQTKIDHCAGVPAWYWPTGSTALGWAAGTGNLPLLTLLLDRGADVSGLVESGQMSPLHEAINLERDETATALIARGADVNARSYKEQVPLHYAVHNNNAKIAQLLIQHGARLELVDDNGRSPLDWAVMNDQPILVELFVSHGQERPSGYTASRSANEPSNGVARLVPAGPSVMGKVLNPLGLPTGVGDGDDASVKATMVPALSAAYVRQTPIFSTGMKIADLFAPFKRGGHNGIFTPLAGVGKTVIMSQVLNRMVTSHNGYAVCIGLDHGGFTGESLMNAWRDMSMDPALISERVVNINGHINDGPETCLQVAETGLTIAEELRASGHDVLLMVDTNLAVKDGVISYLRNNTSMTPKSAITTVYYGTVTVGVEPEALKSLDAVITFDRGRANQGLWPAIDPLRSTSTLLRPELIGADHVAVVDEMRNHFIRYAEVHPAFEKSGEDALLFIEYAGGVVHAKRARKLHRFLTQPLPGVETFVGVPGVYVSVEDTVNGCRAILDGDYDELPEEAFMFTGTIEEVAEKAKKSV